MRASFRSSGDLIADRRRQYGQALFREGDFAAAIELFEQTIERAPSWADAHFSLGKARREIGDRAGAAAAFRECLRLDPEDTLGASLALAELDAAVTIDMAPAAYVRALFDAYADDFDKALVERLDYSTPQQLAAAIRAARKIEARSGRALDLGCGTGLGGEAIVADVAWLEGVDLSPGMIDKAREKAVEGEVIVRAMFQRDGKIREIKILKGLGFGLDQRATDSVRRIGFLPASLDGRPVDARAEIVFDFKLRAVSVSVRAPSS